MGPTGVDWGPGLLVLAAAVAVGAVLTWRLRSAVSPTTPSLPLEVRDLSARREALLRQLREPFALPAACGQCRQLSQRVG